MVEGSDAAERSSIVLSVSDAKRMSWSAIRPGRLAGSLFYPTRQINCGALEVFEEQTLADRLPAFTRVNVFYAAGGISLPNSPGAVHLAF